MTDGNYDIEYFRKFITAIH